MRGLDLAFTVEISQLAVVERIGFNPQLSDLDERHCSYSLEVVLGFGEVRLKLRVFGDHLLVRLEVLVEDRKLCAFPGESLSGRATGPGQIVPPEPIVPRVVVADLTIPEAEPGHTRNPFIIFQEITLVGETEFLLIGEGLAQRNSLSTVLSTETQR